MRAIGLLGMLLLLLAGCGDSDDPENAAPAVEAEMTTPAPDGTVPDALEPGAVSTISAALSDGTEISYVVAAPADFDPSREYPVLLALPPGGQDISLAQSFTESTYAPEALRRGWVVVSPAAPSGALYFQGSEALIPEFLDSTLAWLRPAGGKVHLAGISNGGISAFRLAALNPERYASMVVFPGFPQSEDDRAALGGLDFPIAMFVGGNDTGWVGPMEEAFAALTAAGADATLDIRNGEDHIIGSLSDGVDLFDVLESAAAG